MHNTITSLDRTTRNRGGSEWHALARVGPGEPSCSPRPRRRSRSAHAHPDGWQYTIGVLARANFGFRNPHSVASVPVGTEIQDLWPEKRSASAGRPCKTGSIIVALGTDAPELSSQLRRIATRAGLGVGNTGGIGDDSSGDIFIAFTTASAGQLDEPAPSEISYLLIIALTPRFFATVMATQEAIINALFAAQTMTGINWNRAYAHPHGRLQDALKQYNRFAG